MSLLHMLKSHRFKLLISIIFSLQINTTPASIEIPELVKDINATSTNNSSSPRSLTRLNEILLFTADDGVHGNELWRSDGTAVGTTLVKDIISGSNDSFIYELTKVNEKSFFIVNTDRYGTGHSQLWQTDGSEAGTTIIKTFHSYSTTTVNILTELININGTLFFSAENGSYGKELWKSDGTETGTILVKNIRTGLQNGKPAGSYPRQLTNVNGTLFFTADNGVNGRELWKTDGTEVVMVKDIYAGLLLSNPSNLTNVDGTLFFTADNGINQRELWKSDGTEAGTILVKDIREWVDFDNSGTSYPRQLTNVNGTLFFTADDGFNGEELWKSDGTEAGTILVKDIYTGSVSADPTYLINVNGTLFFTANDGINGDELWKSNGSEVGTTMVKNIHIQNGSSALSGLININGILYFSATDGVHGRELWKSDGTAAGTTMVHDIATGGTSALSSYAHLTYIDGKLFFTANDGQHGEELWKLDTTSPIIALPAITSHEPGSVLNSFNQIFNWTSNETSIAEWWLYVGSFEGAHNLHNSGSLGIATTTDTVGGLPTDGSVVYVRLWYRELLGGSWKYIDTSYNADNSGVHVKPEILTPASGGALSGHTTLFTWSMNQTNVSEWWLFIGTTQGEQDLYNSDSLGGVTTDTVRGLPTDGSLVYVRLWYTETENMSWKYIDTTYTADNSGTPIKPAILSPASGSSLPEYTTLFTWTANTTNVTEWWLFVGTTQGVHDLYNSSSLGASTTATVSDLPSDGSTIYARLWYRETAIGTWKYVDTNYTVFN